MEMKQILKNTIILFLLFTSKISFAQRNYEFNREGNPCYLKYIRYAPNDNYQDYKRPYLMLLGKPGQDAQSAFDQDSLKNLPQFYNYLFVYVPNRGNTSGEKLQCFGALSSLLTFGYTYGNKNLFLQINDPTITSSEVNTTDLTRFNCIRLSNKKMGAADSIIANNNITSDFKEDVSANDKTDDSDDDESAGGTFYYEEDKDNNTAEIAEVKSQKIYFVPPQTFNYTLSGLIKDKATGEALPGATIQIKGTTIGAATNMDGYFTLP